MNEKLQQFFCELESNEGLREKMAACKSAEEAYALASETVNGFTMEEFQSAMKAVRKSTECELSTEDLDGVAGGIETATIIQLGITGVAAIASAAM